MRRRDFIKLGALATAAIALPIKFTKRTFAAGPRHCYWIDGAVGDWDDPRCWKGGHVPRDGDTVTIRSGKCRISHDMNTNIVPSGDTPHRTEIFHNWADRSATMVMT